MRSAWQTRCPRGHSSLEGRNADYYRCRSCERRYKGSPLDAAEHDFPVDDVEDHAMPETPDKIEVLAELVRRCDDGRSGLKANEIQAGPSPSVTQSLIQLRDRGLVEEQERSTASRWIPTDAGQRLGGPSGVSA